MRHKLPYEHDKSEQGASLAEGVSSKQTFGCEDDDYDHRRKERLERSVSKTGKAENDKILQETSPYYFHTD